MDTQDLKRKLENAFKPSGIVAYSGCCRWGCTGSYGGDGQKDFQTRENGVYYIKLFLDGQNFQPEVARCSVCYDAIGVDPFNYLMMHWTEEEQILEKFCQVLGLTEGQYDIIKPETTDIYITIQFNPPLKLKN